MTKLVKLTASEIQQWRQAFKNLDRDKSGSISLKELRVLCDMVGWVKTDNELEKMIKAVDENHHGEIEFEELIHAMESGFFLY
jgi:Ca2+-binding EF-hand superfamily protein